MTPLIVTGAFEGDADVAAEARAGAEAGGFLGFFGAFEGFAGLGAGAVVVWPFGAAVTKVGAAIRQHKTAPTMMEFL